MWGFSLHRLLTPLSSLHCLLLCVTVSLRHRSHSHTVLISCSLSFCPYVTPQLSVPNSPPSLRHALPLSPTYRLWAHLCGCLSHLTTRLTSRGGTADGGHEPQNSETKHSVDVSDVIAQPSWARQAVMTSTPPSSNPRWLMPVFHRENGQCVSSSGLDVEVGCSVRKCWMFLTNVKTETCWNPPTVKPARL